MDFVSPFNILLIWDGATFNRLASSLRDMPSISHNLSSRFPGELTDSFTDISSELYCFLFSDLISFAAMRIYLLSLPSYIYSKILLQFLFPLV